MSEYKPIKLILLGESGVGKTNLIRVAIGKEFDNNVSATLTCSYCESQITVNNKLYKYFLWDTAGQEKYRSLNQLFIKDSKIILLVFAINTRDSFKQVDFWHKYVKDLLGEDNYFFVLIGNKSDLYEADDVVKDGEIEAKAREFGIKYKVTSALTDAVGFRKFLNEIITDYINKYHPEEYKGPNSFKINSKDKKDKPDGKKCC